MKRRAGPMLLQETDRRVYVAPSTIAGAGRGLFAKVPLAKGESLEVIGVLVPAASTSDAATAYADAYKFRVGKFLLIPAGFGSMVNHSASPNMEKVVAGRRVFLRALGPIQKGEELLFIYGPYARQRLMRRRAAKVK
jgi:SET domain-containing protein